MSKTPRFELSNSQVVRAAFFEALFVVLGVVLALVANGWRENRANQRRAEGALASIQEELRINRDAVKDANDYHSAQLAALRAEHDADWAPSFDLFDRGFIYVAPVFSSAWRSAQAAGVFEHLPYETVLVLTRVYSLQDQYESQAQIVSPLIYRQLYEEGAPAILANWQGLASMIGTFSYRERSLLEEYESVLASLAAASD